VEYVLQYAKMRFFGVVAGLGRRSRSVDSEVAPRTWQHLFRPSIVCCASIRCRADLGFRNLFGGFSEMQFVAHRLLLKAVWTPASGWRGHRSDPWGTNSPEFSRERAPWFPRRGGLVVLCFSGTARRQSTLRNSGYDLSGVYLVSQENYDAAPPAVDSFL